MNASELLSEWTDGDSSGMRPKRVQAVRDDLMEYTDEHIPRRLPEIEALILNNPQKVGVITRKLREAAEPSDGDE